MPGVHVPPELFVAYADEDREWVHGFLLAEVGLDRACVVTPDDFRPGAVLVEELERAVTSARCTVMVLTPAFGASPLAALAELLASHDSLRRDSDRLVPLVLKPFELPLHLDFRVRLDCTDPARWPAEMARLRELLQRGTPPPDELACPYPGLIAFGPEQAGLFFGRDRESDEISRLVRQHGFLLVVGPSGSGKSSLVSAGVLPRLRAADGDRWLVRTVRPGASVSPLAARARPAPSGQRRRTAGHGARDRAAAPVRRPGRSDLRAADQRGPGPVPGADRPAAPDRGPARWFSLCGRTSSTT